MSIQRIDSDSGRVYATPAGTFPSITTILSATKDMTHIKKWRDRIGEAAADKVLKDAGLRGTATHSVLERKYLQQDFVLDQDEEYISLDPKIQLMIRLISNELDANNFHPVHTEIKLYHPELKYAGTCDGIGWFNNTLVVIDYKTSIKKKPIEHVNDYFIQATAYALAYNFLHKSNIKKIVILLATEDGFLQKWSMPVNAYIGILKARLNSYYAC